MRLNFTLSTFNSSKGKSTPFRYDNFSRFFFFIFAKSKSIFNSPSLNERKNSSGLSNTKALAFKNIPSGLNSTLPFVPFMVSSKSIYFTSTPSKAIHPNIPLEAMVKSILRSPPSYTTSFPSYPYCANSVFTLILESFIVIEYGSFAVEKAKSYISSLLFPTKCKSIPSVLLNVKYPFVPKAVCSIGSLYPKSLKTVVTFFPVILSIGTEIPGS